MKIQSINPATEEINQELELFSDKKIIEICSQSRAAYPHWKKFTVPQRADYLRRIAKILRANKNEYAKLMTLEMGKPIGQSFAEIEKCAWSAEIFAEHAELWSSDEIIKTEAKKSFVTHEPLGVILGIMPWNFPFWQLIRFALPALAMGNTVILKHSNVVPLCALALEELFKEAGFPENVFRTILSEHDIIKKIVKRNLVQGISITGSVNAGRKIGELGGKNIKKFVLELGGSDPFIVLDDADLMMTAKKAVEGRNINSGQSCVCAKRFIVVKKAADDFLQKFLDNMKNLIVGDPFDEKTNTGPLASKKQVELLEKQVNESTALGAKILIGGKKLERKGFFYLPTIMIEIKKHMPVFKQEVFGPVAPVMIVKNEKEAVKMANFSNLGLGGSVWTQNLEKGEKIAREIEAGVISVNEIVKSDPRLPFGGIKDSGIGRELSRYGMLEFVNTKSVMIQ